MLYSLDMKFVIFGIIISVCCAQTPTRPSIAETFASQVKIIVRLSEMFEGSGIIAQDPEKRVAVQNILYDHNGANETNLNLLRYDMGEQFEVTGFGILLHCEIRKVLNGTYIPQYWGWVRLANFTGTVTIEGEKLDRWLFSGPGLKIELLVATDKVDIPRFVNYQLAAQRTEMDFVTFSPTTPDEKYFVIPKVCEKH